LTGRCSQWQSEKANGWQVKVAICACSLCLEAYLKKCLANDPHITFTNYAPKADVVIAEEGLLTKAEQKCLQALSEEGNIPAIAKKLSYHPATVKRHLQKAYRKLKVRGRVQAIVMAFRLGLIR